MKSFSLLFTFFCLFNVSNVHDIHISKAEIDYKTDDKMVQISLHIFLDDLEDELELISGDNINLCTEKESEKAEEYLITYIEKNFSLSSEGKALEMKFIGKEASEDLLAVWCYLMVENVQLENLKLDYKVMMSRFDDQKNIVAFKKNGKREGFFILDQNSDTQKLL